MVSCDILQKYKLKLKELTSNDKFVITDLSKLADEYFLYARDIVPIIESHLFRVSPSLKLTVFYLIDCIVKNVGRDYGALFCNNLVANFCHVFKQANDEMRFKLLKLRETWKDVIPSNVLFVLDAEISQLEQNESSNFQPRNDRKLMGYQNNSDDGYRNTNMLNYNQQNVPNNTFGHHNNSHPRELPIATGTKRHFNDNNDFARNKRIRNQDDFRHGPRTAYKNSSNVVDQNLKFNSVNVRCDNSTVFVNNSNSINHAHRREENYNIRKESNRSRKRKNRKMNRQIEAHFENANKMVFDTSVPPPNYKNVPPQSFSNSALIGNESARVPPICSAISQDKTGQIVDVQNLFKQLMAHGLVPSNTSTSNSEDKNNLKMSFGNLSSLQSRSFVEKMWFEGNQCTHCGLRFDYKEKDEYNEHVKTHEAPTFKSIQKPPIMERNWYYNKSDWVNNKKIPSLIPRKENNDDEKPKKKIPFAIAEPNVAVTRCCVCTDKFECYFDHDEDEWLLKDAIREENKVFCSLCYEDMQISKKRKLNEN